MFLPPFPRLLLSAALPLLLVTSASGAGATLREAAAGRIEIGAAIPGAEMPPAELQLVADQFTNVTPENCMKPAVVQPSEGKFDFAAADKLVDFALANNLKVNGHTLVWHSQCPEWIFQNGAVPAGRDLVLQRMRLHIQTVASRFRGRVVSWDVVNEAISDGGEYLRPSKWLTLAGPDFIPEAFRAARLADPRAALYYNDYNIEQPAKRDKALRLIADLKASDAPIDGIGIQGHWTLDQVPFKDIEDAIIAFKKTGLKVAITELDIDVVPRKKSSADVGRKEEGGDDPYAAGLPPELQERQARQYAQLFEIFRRQGVVRVTFWGFQDGRSWLNTWPRKRTNHALLWTRDLLPKPSFQAVVSSLQGKTTP